MVRGLAMVGVVTVVEVRMGNLKEVQTVATERGLAEAKARERTYPPTPSGHGNCPQAEEAELTTALTVEVAGACWLMGRGPCTATIKALAMGVVEVDTIPMKVVSQGSYSSKPRNSALFMRTSNNTTRRLFLVLSNHLSADD